MPLQFNFHFSKCVKLTKILCVWNMDVFTVSKEENNVFSFSFLLFNFSFVEKTPFWVYIEIANGNNKIQKDTRQSTTPLKANAKRSYTLIFNEIQLIWMCK